jgi:hypothetical protein
MAQGAVRNMIAKDGLAPAGRVLPQIVRSI